MNSTKGWLKLWRNRELRKAKRQPRPGLVAHYWTGAPPMSQTIADISSTGLYLLTKERWYPGTLINITLQGTNGAEGGHERSATVQSRVVRLGPDGVGLEFVLGRAQGTGPEMSEQNVVSDQKSLDRFLEQFRTNKGRIFTKVV